LSLEQLKIATTAPSQNKARQDNVILSSSFLTFLTIAVLRVVANHDDNRGWESSKESREWHRVQQRDVNVGRN
jgi:hypothetical protein